jgi:hypothetical protein
MPREGEAEAALHRGHLGLPGLLQHLHAQVLVHRHHHADGICNL